MRGEVADGVVKLGRCVDDRLRMVSKACQMAAVLLGEKRLLGSALAAVVELQGFITESREEELARVVERK